MFHSAITITWGNQKWNGAIPNLIASDKIIMFLELINKFLMAISVFSIVVVKIKIRDAIACGIKYLMADSVNFIVGANIINGMALIKLISSPIHAVIHELADIVMMVPVIINLIKTIMCVLINIKKEEIRLL